MPSPADDLRSHLSYSPQPLKFGTSGRRGQVIHLTQLEIYTNVVAEIEYLQSLSPTQGGVKTGDDFYYAHDLRPSSIGSVDGRGGLAQAVEQALKDKNMRSINLGAIPTPALTYFALRMQKGSVMVTGSHIPFDRNGYKLNTANGELLKKDERPINEAVELARERFLSQSFAESLFDERGMFRSGTPGLASAVSDGKTAYVQRYLDFFQGETLNGLKLLVYQHSAVGRDVLVEILEKLGAQVVTAGRSDTFVPIDTEAIDQAQLDTIQGLCDQAGQKVDAVLSTDGDSDRPLLVARDGDKLRFYGGDLLGMIVAEFLQADSVVVPISTNDAIDRGPLAGVTEPKTKIGSPYVIAGMQHAVEVKGRNRVCGWEANGGFLTGSDITRNGKTLPALPTRDAVLPLLCVLFAAKQRKVSLPDLFASLPHRFSRAALLRNFPRPTSMKIIQRFSLLENNMQEIEYQADRVIAHDANHTALEIPETQQNHLTQLRITLQMIFTTADPGFPAISRLNYTDGVRIIFSNGDVAHFRPSGNADELRIYAVADTQARADDIAARGIAEPDGLLRRLERVV